jgi:dUTP pyrophosphatase
VLIRKLQKSASIPIKAHKTDAGYDLYANNNDVIEAYARKTIPTDIQLYLPKGVYARVAARSSLAINNGIIVGGGVIDRGYTGNVGAILFNVSDTPFKVNKGDRIAQLIFEKIASPIMVEVDNFPNTERGVKGFGSSGK